jgi:mannosyltransferase
VSLPPSRQQGKPRAAPPGPAPGPGVTATPGPATPAAAAPAAALPSEALPSEDPAREALPAEDLPRADLPREDLPRADPLAGDGTATRRAGALRYAPAVTAAAVMAVLGLWGLARRSAMGNDEVVTRWAAKLGLRQLAHLLRHVDAVHGLYFLVMHGWMAVGTSPAVMRIPSVLAMTAAVAMTAVLGGRLAGSGWAGLFAGLAMALTPAISFYAQTARSYALVMACVLGATLALVRALANGTAGPGQAGGTECGAESSTAESGTAAASGAAAAGRSGPGGSGRPALRRWLLYGALIALGGYLNEMALLVLAAHAVTVLLARPGRRVVAAWAGAAAGGTALVIPLIVVSSRQDVVVNWIQRPGWHDLLVLFRDYFGPVTAIGVILAGCAVLALLPPGGGRRSRRGPGPASPGAGEAAARPWWRMPGVTLPSVALPLLLVPATVLFVESLVSQPLYVDRYVLYGEAGAALLAGAGMYRLGRWLSTAAGYAPGSAGYAPGSAGGPERGPTGARQSARAQPGAWHGALTGVPGAVLCVCVLVAQFGAQQRARTPQSRLFDFGAPSRYLAAHAAPGDGILYFTSFYRKAALGYPADFRHVKDFALAVPPVRTGNYQGLDLPAPAVATRLRSYQRVWVFGRVPSPALAGAYRAESLLLARDFTMTAQQRYGRITVTLWTRR